MREENQALKRVANLLSRRSEKQSNSGDRCTQQQRNQHSISQSPLNLILHSQDVAVMPPSKQAIILVHVQKFLCHVLAGSGLLGGSHLDLQRREQLSLPRATVDARIYGRMNMVDCR